MLTPTCVCVDCLSEVADPNIHCVTVSEPDTH